MRQSTRASERVIVNEEVIDIKALRSEVKKTGTRFWVLLVLISLLSSLVVPYLSMASVVANDSTVFDGDVIPGYSMGGIDIPSYGVDLNSWAKPAKQTNSSPAIVQSQYGYWTPERAKNAAQNLTDSQKKDKDAENAALQGYEVKDEILSGDEKARGWIGITRDKGEGTGLTNFSSAPAGEQAADRKTYNESVAPYRTQADYTFWDSQTIGGTSPSVTTTIYPDFVIVGWDKESKRAQVLTNPDSIQNMTNSTGGSTSGALTGTSAVPHYVPLSTLFKEFKLSDTVMGSDGMVNLDTLLDAIAAEAKSHGGQSPTLNKIAENASNNADYDLLLGTHYDNLNGENKSQEKGSDAWNPYPYSMVFKMATDSGTVVSSIYNNNEAYVYFSPQSAYTNYLALRSEYDALVNNNATLVADKDPAATFQLGYYLAGMSILEAYLSETLPQDMTRGYVGPSEGNPLAAAGTPLADAQKLDTRSDADSSVSKLFQQSLSTVDVMSVTTTGTTSSEQTKKEDSSEKDLSVGFRSVPYSQLLYDFADAAIVKYGQTGRGSRLGATSAIMNTLSTYGYGTKDSGLLTNGTSSAGQGPNRGMTRYQNMTRMTSFGPYGDGAESLRGSARTDSDDPLLNPTVSNVENTGMYVPVYYPIQQHVMPVDPEMTYRFQILSLIPYNTLAYELGKNGFNDSVVLSYANNDLENLKTTKDFYNKNASLAKQLDDAEDGTESLGQYDKGRSIIINPQTLTGTMVGDTTTKQYAQGKDLTERVDNALLAFTTGRLNSDNVHDLLDIVRAIPGLKYETFVRCYNPIKSSGGATDFFLTRVTPAQTPYMPTVLASGYESAGGVTNNASAPSTASAGFDYFSIPSFSPCLAAHTADDTYYGALTYELRPFYTSGFLSSLPADANIPALEQWEETIEKQGEISSETAIEGIKEKITTIYVLAKRLAYSEAYDNLQSAGNGGEGTLSLGSLYHASGKLADVLPDTQEIKAALTPSDLDKYVGPENDTGSEGATNNTHEGAVSSANDALGRDIFVAESGEIRIGTSGGTGLYVGTDEQIYAGDPKHGGKAITQSGNGVSKKLTQVLKKNGVSGEWRKAVIRYIDSKSYLSSLSQYTKSRGTSKKTDGTAGLTQNTTKVMDYTSYLTSMNDGRNQTTLLHHEQRSTDSTGDSQRVDVQHRYASQSRASNATDAAVDPSQDASANAPLGTGWKVNPESIQTTGQQGTGESPLSLTFLSSIYARILLATGLATNSGMTDQVASDAQSAAPTDGTGPTKEEIETVVDNDRNYADNGGAADAAYLSDNLAKRGYSKAIEDQWASVAGKHQSGDRITFYVPTSLKLETNAKSSEFDYAMQEFGQRHVLTDATLGNRMVWCKDDNGYAFVTSVKTIFSALYKDSYNRYLTPNSNIYYWDTHENIAKYGVSPDYKKVKNGEVKKYNTVATEHWSKVSDTSLAKESLDKYCDGAFAQASQCLANLHMLNKDLPSQMQNVLAWADTQTPSESEGNYLSDPSDANETLVEITGEDADDEQIDTIRSLADLEAAGFQVVNNAGDWAAMPDMKQSDLMSGNLKSRIIRGVAGSTYTASGNLAAYTITATVGRIDRLVSTQSSKSSIPYSGICSGNLNSGTERYALLQAHSIDRQSISSGLAGDLRKRDSANALAALNNPQSTPETQAYVKSTSAVTNELLSSAIPGSVDMVVNAMETQTSTDDTTSKTLKGTSAQSHAGTILGTDKTTQTLALASTFDDTPMNRESAAAQTFNTANRTMTSSGASATASALGSVSENRKLAESLVNGAFSDAYSVIQSIALIMVLAFLMIIAFQNFIAYSNGKENDYIMAQTKLKTVLPRTLIAVAMIGLPPLGGGVGFQGGCFLLLQIVNSVMDAVLGVLTQGNDITTVLQEIGQTFITDINVFDLAGTVLNLVAALIFIVCSAIIMLLVFLTDIILFLFWAIGPIAWAFYVWPYGGAERSQLAEGHGLKKVLGTLTGKMGSKVFMNGEIGRDAPTGWLMGYIMTLSTTVKWVFLYWGVGIAFNILNGKTGASGIVNTIRTAGAADLDPSAGINGIDVGGLVRGTGASIFTGIFGNLLLALLFALVTYMTFRTFKNSMGGAIGAMYGMVGDITSTIAKTAGTGLLGGLGNADDRASDLAKELKDSKNPLKRLAGTALDSKPVQLGLRRTGSLAKGVEVVANSDVASNLTNRINKMTDNLARPADERDASSGAFDNLVTVGTEREEYVDEDGNTKMRTRHVIQMTDATSPGAQKPRKTLKEQYQQLTVAKSMATIQAHVAALADDPEYRALRQQEALMRLLESHDVDSDARVAMKALSLVSGQGGSALTPHEARVIGNCMRAYGDAYINREANVARLSQLRRKDTRSLTYRQRTALDQSIQNLEQSVSRADDFKSFAGMLGTTDASLTARMEGISNAGKEELLNREIKKVETALQTEGVAERFANLTERKPKIMQHRNEQLMALTAMAESVTQESEGATGESAPSTEA